ncbi:MAG TPA: hypothetical protein VMD97_02075 [Candidatus Aquilonibacter sp.]|nr:hypothetical protein [Candidatus Aquilonibacter sp.]
MSVITDIQTAGKKVGDFLAEVVTFAGKARALYNSLSGPVLAASLAVFNDVVKAVGAAQGAASDAAEGDVPGAITLSETTVGLVKQVVSDFKSGEKTIVADFDALGIKL